MTKFYALELGGSRVVLSATDAYWLAYTARYLRVGRVKRTGRRGQRGWVIRPRNKAEWPKRPGVLRGHH